MNYFKSLFVLLLIILFLQYPLFAQESRLPQDIKKLPKKARPYLKEMVFLQGGMSRVDANPRVLPLPKDTSLIVESFSKDFYVQDFMLLDHEVTNNEYRLFVDWVKALLDNACCYSIFARKISLSR
jgi:formylglycine-generating enzyme required for sulfatase activity